MLQVNIEQCKQMNHGNKRKLEENKTYFGGKLEKLWSELTKVT